MLREFQLKNFKAFADAAPLLIRPITLLYGPNFAGKSSIIQSLMLLKQTLEESDDADVVLLPKGKLVDLGNYREFVHLHETNRCVAIKVKLDSNPDDIAPPEAVSELSETLTRIYNFLYSQLVEFPTISLELEFSVESTRSDISLSRVTMWIGSDDCPAITYERTDQGLKVSQLYPQHSFWQNWWKEYDLILENRVFNQLNSTLQDYDIPEISSRNRSNTIEELDTRQSVLLEDQKEVKKALLVWETKLIALEDQKTEVEVDLSSLRSKQNVTEEVIKKQIKSLEEQIIFYFQQKLNTRFNIFITTSEQVNSFIADLEFNNQITHEIKSDLSIQQAKYQEIQKSSKEPSKEEKIGFDNLKQKLENQLRYEIESYLKDGRLSSNLNKEEEIWFTNYQSLVDQLKKMGQEHKEESKSLELALANVEKKINSYKQIDPEEIKEQIVNKLQIFELLKQIWKRFTEYDYELALEDYLKILCNFTVLSSNFLVIEEFETSVSELQIDTSLKFEIEFLQGVYENAQAVRYLFNTSFYGSDILRRFFQEARYLGPIRDYPERFYTFSGASAKAVGKSGTGSSDLLFKDHDFLDRVNQKLKIFKIGHQVKIMSFQDQETNEPSDVYAIRLIDDFSQSDVSLLDVGFGVSQVLPVIIQSLFSRDQTILIEQPEVHIHPRLQTELGDLFIDSVKDFGNRFIIETHSEHLMLRLQRRIREGVLKSDDVSVLYVDRSDDGSICLQLRLDSEGDFIDHWPDGFFDEDYNEIVG